MSDPPNYIALTTADLPLAATRRVRAAGRDLLVANVAGDYIVLENQCPHAGATLHDRPLQGCLLTCPWHGSQFDLAADQVRRGPAIVMPPRFPARVVGAWVEAAL